MLEVKNPKKEENKELQEYMLALENPEKKQLVNLGNSIFPNSEKRQLEVERGIQIERKNVEATLSTLRGKYKQVFSIDEIKAEMLEYNLDFVPTRNYTGSYDYNYIEKVDRFIKDNNLNMGAGDHQYSFYVLTSPTTKKNPLIFYKHREGGSTGTNYYVIIDGDKNYVNVWNWLMGYIDYDRKTFAIFTGIAVALITMLICNVIGAFLVPGIYQILVPIVLSIIGYAFGRAIANDNDLGNFKQFKVASLNLNT